MWVVFRLCILCIFNCFVLLRIYSLTHASPLFGTSVNNYECVICPYLADCATGTSGKPPASGMVLFIGSFSIKLVFILPSSGTLKNVLLYGAGV